MRRKILIVDDDKSARVMLQKFMTENNYDSMLASNGKEAMEILYQNENFSAIILDIIMPVMDGYEVLSRIRSDEKLNNIPIIVQTADRDSEKKALSLGANDCIIKPSDSEILMCRLRNTIELRENAAILNAIRRDSLTGLLSRNAFLEQVEQMVELHEEGHYVLSCIDIEKFKVVNDLYGTHKGDEVLKIIAGHFSDFIATIDGICCRSNADNFAILYPADMIDTLAINEVRERATLESGFLRTITFSVGRYVIVDKTLSASAMYDRAMIAKATIKGLYDKHIATYDESMRSKIISEQEIVSEMNHALKEHQFEVWYQPQFNHETGALVGCEALVRWRHPVKGLISPGIFIPIFEKNGFVYEIDKYVWEQSCIFQRYLLDQNASPVPVSVNISRYDIFQTGLCDYIVSLTEKYHLDPDLLRLEITESAFAKSTDQIIHVVEQFKLHGFLVEIDDFGSGYSSLNTLKDVPADVLKLDMKFLEGEKNSEKGGNIVASIVRMAKWIGMSVIAEGVETVHQANFLRSIGCCYIQGYLYSKPLPQADYEHLLVHSQTEGTILTLEKVETYDMETFWNPSSIETLMFNSFVGGACIFEYHNSKIDILRINEKYVKIFGSNILTESFLLNTDIRAHICEDDYDKVQQRIKEAIASKEEVVDDITFHDYLDPSKQIYVRCVIRVIAKSGDRYLFYCMMEDVTEQRNIEMNQSILVQEIETEHETCVQLQFTNNIAHIILEHSDAEESIHEILKRLTEHFNGDQAFLTELSPNHKHSSNTYEYCSDGITSKKNYFQDIPTEYSSDWLNRLQNNEMIYINDIALMKEGRDDIRSILIERRIRSLILAPIFLNENLVGFYGVDNPRQQLNKYDRILDLGNLITMTLIHRDLQLASKQHSKAITRLMTDTPGGFCQIAVHSPECCTIEFVNPGFCALLGMSEKEVLDLYGNNAKGFIAPADIDTIETEGLKRIADGNAFNIKCRLIQKDQSLLWVSVFGRFTKTVDGTIYLNSYYTDIKEQMDTKQTQVDLLDNLPCGAALYQYDGTDISVIHINKKFWELVNHEPLDCSNINVLNWIHPDDIAIVYQEILSAIRQNRNCFCDIRIHYGESEYRAFHIVASVKSYEDGKYIIYASYHLIDEEAMSLQAMLPVALSTMMEASEEYAFVKDKEQHYICASESSAKIIGLNSARDIIGLSDTDLFPEEIATQYISEDTTILKHGKAVINHTVLLKEKNGTIHMVSSSKYPLKSPSGEVIGIYGIGRDITSTKESEVQLHLLINSIPGGVAAFSFKENVITTLFFNEGFYSYSGYTREEYIQITKENPLSIVLEEDRHIITDIIDNFYKNSDTSVVSSCNYRCMTKDHSIRWMNMKCKLSMLGDNINILNVVQVDVTDQRLMIEKLRVTEEAYHIATRHSGRTVGRYNIADKTLTLTSEAAEQYELPVCIEDVPMGRVKLGKISEETKDVYIEFFENICNGELEGDVLFQKLLPNGWRWINAHSTTLFDKDGTPTSALISYIDVTDQYEKDAIYRKWQQSLKSRADGSYSLFRCSLDLSNGSETTFESCEGSLIPFTYVECAVTSFDRCTSKYAGEHVYPEDQEEYISTLQSDKLISDYYRGKRKKTLEYRELITKNTYRWLRRSVDLVERSDGCGIMIYLMFENIDESKRAELDIHTLAETDALTGLLNRNAFTERLNDRLAHRNKNSQYAFLILDIDKFKSVNDTLGHAAGDQVLIESAQFIRSALMSHDLIGRLGGDEFVICLCDVPDKNVIRKKVRQIWQLIRRPIGNSVQISASIGIALCPEDGEDFDTLYQKADKALYQIKKSGKDNYGFYIQ